MTTDNPSRPDPYEFLGIEATASAEDIRAAYRRRARTLHPDMGGGSGDFRTASDCANLLLNAQNRERFDSTGLWPDEKADIDTRTVALDHLTQLCLAIVEHSGGDLSFDLVATAKNEIRKRQKAVEEEMAKLKREAKHLRKAAKRITRKGGGVPFLRTAFLHRAGELEMQAKNGEQQLKMTQEMLDILADHEWEPEQLMILNHLGTSGTQTTTYTLR